MDKNLNKYISEKKKEKYITDEKICELILNYIKKENTEYAILIDGKWGVGKTFFVKNTLETKLQKEIKKFGRYKGIIYISLCGIRYINQLENARRKPTLDMLDKIANGINKNIDLKANVTAADLITYNKNHKTSFCRIDERK